MLTWRSTSTFRRPLRTDLCVVSALLVAAFAKACASRPDSCDEGSCPSGLPSKDACATAPSYSSDVAALVSGHCSSCHGPGGVEQNKPLVTYDDVYALRSEVLSQVYGCHMPPRCSPPLSPAGRQVMLQWLVCGAKND